MSIEMVRDKFLSEIEAQCLRRPIARRYSAEFRDELVKLHSKGVSLSELEKNFLCGRKLLTRWTRNPTTRQLPRFVALTAAGERTSPRSEGDTLREISLKTPAGLELRIPY